MMKRLALLPLLLVGSAVSLGCQNPEEDSCNIKTPGIYVEYEVFEEGSGATARATFWVGDKPGGTFLTLGSCGDKVAVNGVSLSKNTSNVDHDYYEASVPVADNYEYIFTREDEDPYSSSVSAPPNVTVTGPASTATISRATGFDVTWENNGNGGNIELLISNSDCIKDYPEVLGKDIPDNGKHTVAANGIEPFVSSDKDKSCVAKIELTRTAAGTLNSKLKGTIKGNSIGRGSFTSTP